MEEREGDWGGYYRRWWQFANVRLDRIYIWAHKHQCSFTSNRPHGESVGILTPVRFWSRSGDDGRTNTVVACRSNGGQNAGGVVDDDASTIGWCGRTDSLSNNSLRSCRSFSVNMTSRIRSADRGGDDRLQVNYTDLSIVEWNMLNLKLFLKCT
jgi:hypothetical protein